VIRSESIGFLRGNLELIARWPEFVKSVGRLRVTSILLFGWAPPIKAGVRNSSSNSNVTGGMASSLLEFGGH
jgi:hypothetical protein